MYKCSKCGKGVLVKDLPTPIRACNCTKDDGVTPATIVLEMEGEMYGKSDLKQK
jgi:hypothetical protein